MGSRNGKVSAKEGVDTVSSYFLKYSSSGFSWTPTILTPDIILFGLISHATCQLSGNFQEVK